MPAPSAPMPIHLSLSLFEVATGLRSGTPEIFDLNAEKVCKNALRIVQRRSPFLAKAISTLVPLAFLGYGSYLYLWRPLRLETAINYISSFFFAEVVVEGNDTARQHVKDWIAGQASSPQGRSVTLVLDGNYGRSSDTPYKYVSSAQTSWFKYDGRWLRFEDQAVPEKPAESDGYGRRVRVATKPDLKISCLSLTGDNGPVRNFLEHIKDDNKDESYTYIYRVSRNFCDSDVWDQPISRPVRTLDTVAMEVATRQNIIASVEKYLAPETSNWYAQRGLPLRKGILLHGPPGTGKTSFSTALAGHFGLDLYILSFTSTEMDDGKLATLFSELPAQCVVLMEDVDSAGIERENIVKKPTTDLLTPKKRVTLSGLLNVIDGAGASEGRLLIMTSNSANSLDPALVRPGRIDHKIFMGEASQEVANILFTQIYTDLDEELSDTETVVDSQPDIDLLAKTFASKVEANLFTPAEIQAFLLSHRESPEDALGCVDDWAEKLKDIKITGHNVKESYSAAASQATTVASNEWEWGDPPSQQECAQPWQEECTQSLQRGRPISRRHSWSCVDANTKTSD
ncbi:hypothetical protein BST61_g4371 [Cercospora zeina]